MKNLLNSWKTTLIAVIVITGSSFAFYYAKISVEQWTGAIVIGAGFLITKDSDK